MLGVVQLRARVFRYLGMPIAKIIIDFDDTLFDTTSLKEDLLALFGRFGISAEKFWETYRITYNQNDLASYNLWRHIDIVCQQFTNLDKKLLLFEAKEILSNGKKYLIDGAENFLQGLRNFSAPLILLSLGDAEFQKQKVKSAGVAKFFHKVIFTGRDKKEAIQPLIKDTIGDIIFINDKINETREVTALSAQIKPILRVKKGIPVPENEQSGLPFFQRFDEMSRYIKTMYDVILSKAQSA